MSSLSLRKLFFASLAALPLAISVQGIAMAQDSNPVTVPPVEADAPAANLPPSDPSLVTPPPPPLPEENSVQADAIAPEAAAKPASTENPYGLGALWSNGDIIARGVLIIMAVMSLGSWVIIVVKFLEQRRLFIADKEVQETFWHESSVDKGLRKLDPSSPFRYIAESGVAAANLHSGSILGNVDKPSWISTSIQRAVDTINSRLQTHLAFLGTVGSVSPFIGLFGTVWGIYHALTAIGIAGQASIDKVAGPVGESLIMTAIGLATAVPAVLGYNFLIRRNKVGMDHVRNFAADTLAILIGGQAHDASLRSVENMMRKNNSNPAPSSVAKG